MNYPPGIDSQNQTKKIKKFIKTTLKKAGKENAVIAISGGIDSSTTLLLAAKALNPKNIYPVFLPSKTSDPQDFKHAKKLTSQAKIPDKNIREIHIGSIVQKTWRIIKHHTPPQPQAEKATKNRKTINQQTAMINRLRLANITARSRMTVIYDQAKLLDALVIGTENRSEHLLGYYTRFGDEASDLEPIKHLYKTQVKALAKYLDLPREILNKKPSAGLWPGQTDEEELGFSYDVADPALYLYYEQDMSSEEISKILDKNTQKKGKFSRDSVDKVINWAEKNQFKHQVPYSLKSEGS